MFRCEPKIIDCWFDFHCVRVTLPGCDIYDVEDFCEYITNETPHTDRTNKYELHLEQKNQAIITIRVSGKNRLERASKYANTIAETFLRGREQNMMKITNDVSSIPRFRVRVVIEDEDNLYEILGRVWASDLWDDIDVNTYSKNELYLDITAKDEQRARRRAKYFLGGETPFSVKFSEDCED